MEASQNGHNVPGVRPPTAKQVRSFGDIVKDLTADQKHGRPVPHSDRVLALRELGERGWIPSLEPMLPLLLNLDGAPYTLRDHYPFAPLFRAMMPKQVVLRTGRQVSKSTSMAAHSVITANAIPNFRKLHITPLYEQIRRFSNNYVRPFINNSPVRTAWCGTSTENSVLQRSFKNGSMMLFSFALLDADRIRGVSAHAVACDEFQDLDPDFIPIILETMGASTTWGLFQMAGTSKTLDNILEVMWKESSQAEWFIPCLSCNTWNIPALEFHAAAMIGPAHDAISETCPGTVCYKCRKPISPRHGHWVHRFKDRRWLFPGYHVPQIIMPMHFAYPDKWSDLVRKQSGYNNTTEAVFWNEVMGEAVDTGQKLLSETDLKAACLLPWTNNPKQPNPEIFPLLKHYRMRMAAIDWGGGGEKGVSFTVITILGLRDNGQIDVLWGKRLLLGSDHLREAKECLHWINAFRCDMITHDYTGAGEVREAVMIQSGANIDRIMAVRLGRGAHQDMMVFRKGTPLNLRQHYQLDKPRSLMWTAQAIKLKRVQFFKWDKNGKDDVGLISDFLALIEEKAETRLAGDVFTITRNPLLSDDFAQAVNIGCASIWHIHGWPNFAQLLGVGILSQMQVEAAGNADYGWAEDYGPESYFGMP